MSDTRLTTDFLEHATRCSSQYDETCRTMASEILSLRAELSHEKETGFATSAELEGARAELAAKGEESANRHERALSYAREVDSLKAQLAQARETIQRLTKPVTDEEWAERLKFEPRGMTIRQAPIYINALLSSRARGSQ